MAQRLGKSYLRSRRVIATAIAPNYDVLLRIPYADLPSGGGAFKDYLVVVSAKMGNIRGNCRARMGLRMGPVVFFETVHQVDTVGTPLSWRTGSDLYGMTYFAVHPLQDWPVGADLEVFAEHIPNAPGAIESSYSDVMVWIVDLGRYGATRTLPGTWTGDDIRVRTTTYSGGLGLTLEPNWLDILNTDAIGASTGTWLLLYGTQLMMKGSPTGVPGSVGTFVLRGLWPETDTWTPPDTHIELGTGGTARGFAVGTSAPNDSQHVYSVGSFVPVNMADVAQSFRLQGRARLIQPGHLPHRIFGATLVAMRINHLDGFFAQYEKGTVVDGVARSWFSSAAHQRLWDNDRDLDNLAFLSTISPLNAWSYRGWANVNGWGETGVGGTLADNLLVFGSTTSGAQVTAAALVDPSIRPAPQGGVLVNVDYDGVNDNQPDPRIGHDRKEVAFQLSDFGPSATPEPPTLTEIVLTPTREVDVTALPAFYKPPSSFSPMGIADDWNQLLSESGYPIRWGKDISPREFGRLEWVDLSKTDALLQMEQLTKTWPRAFKFQPPEDIDSGALIRPWIVRPRSQSLRADGQLHTVACEIIELIYFDRS